MVNICQNVAIVLCCIYNVSENQRERMAILKNIFQGREKQSLHKVSQMSSYILRLLLCLSSHIRNFIIHIFSFLLALRPNAGNIFFIPELSRLHTTAQHSR